MKFTSPNLDLEEAATDELIKSSISALKCEPDAFAILEKDEMNYIQALVTDNGFIVQFQNGSIEEHYEFDTYLSKPVTIGLFQAYLNGIENWQGSQPFTKIDLRGFWGRLGYSVGNFLGSLVHGYENAKKKT